MRALEDPETEDRNQEYTNAKADAALSAERSATQGPRAYAHLWDGITSESAEQILGVNFDDLSEYGTQEEPVESQRHIISAGDIELPDVEVGYKDAVREMLTKFEDMRQGQLGEGKGRSHKIDLISGARPQADQPYLAGDYKRKVIQESIDELLAKRVIEPAHSERAAPVVLFPISDDTLRLCVDYRRLSSLTTRDTHALTRMDDCLESLTDAQFFTTLDCNRGYWQLPIAQRDRIKTAFVSHAGHYQWVRMHMD